MTRLPLAAALGLCLLLGLGDISSDPTMQSLRWLELAPATLLLLGACAMALRTLAVRPARSLAHLAQPADGDTALALRAALPPGVLLLPLLVWLAVLQLSAAASPAHRTESLTALARPVSGAALALAIYSLTTTFARWTLVARALALGGLAVATIGLLAIVLPPLQAWLTTLHDTTVPIADVPRLASTLSHPNIAAIVFELTLPLLLAAALCAAGRTRTLMLALCLAQLVALVLTFSRAALVAELVALSLMAAIALIQRKRTPFAIIASGIAIVPLGLGIGATLTPQVERRLLAELESTSYQATYAAPSEITVAPQQVVDVPVQITNAGDSPWTSGDPSRVALGYHLLKPDGTPVEFDAPATLLPADVAPKASLDIAAHVYAPAAAGTYVVQWDALREGVAWFSWRGSPPTPMNLLVEPGRPAGVIAAEEPVALPRPARVQFWGAALDMLRDHPLLGVGPDNFRLQFTSYTGVDESHIGTHAHNLYLESLANTGILGFLALGAFLVSILRLASTKLRASTPTDVWLWRAALLAALVAWLVHGLVDDLERFLPAQIAFWVVVGLAARGVSLRAGTDRASNPL